jgi:hypothetical protein
VVGLGPSASIPLAAFPYAWRFLDERWDMLPQRVLDRLRPLDPEASQAVTQRGRVLRRGGPFVVNTDRYRAVAGHTLVSDDLPGDALVRRWLAGLPIGAGEAVYVSWGNGAVLVTDWETCVEVWDSLFYPFDTVDVFDDTLAWAVLMGPEEWAVFVVGGAGNSAAVQYADPGGLRLVQFGRPDGDQDPSD